MDAVGMPQFFLIPACFVTAQAVYSWMCYRCPSFRDFTPGNCSYQLAAFISGLFYFIVLRNAVALLF